MKMKTYPVAEEYRYTRYAKKTFTKGEYREPKKGEWFLSGAIAEAYKAPNDLSQKYYIAVEVSHD